MENTEGAKLYRSSFPTIAVILSLIAFFVYGNSVPAALAVLLMSLLFGLIAGLSGMIPFAGPVIYWLVVGKWLFPTIMSWASIYPTWVTGLIYWFNFIIAILICILTSFVILSAKKGGEE